MHISHHPVLCLDCQHRWVGEIVNDAPVNLCLASWKALYCPQCRAGWKRLAFVSEHADA